MKKLILSAIIFLISAQSHAFKMERIEKVSDAWIAETAQTINSNKENNNGICGKFYAAYKVQTEEGEDLSLSVSTMLIRDAIMSFGGESVDLVTNSHIEMDSDDLEVKIRNGLSSVVGDKKDILEALTKNILSHKQDLETNKEIYRGSAAFVMKSEKTGLLEQSIIHHVSLVDLDKKEFIFVGSGNCQ